jgi:hypothetical protein
LPVLARSRPTALKLSAAFFAPLKNPTIAAILSIRGCVEAALYLVSRITVISTIYHPRLNQTPGGQNLEINGNQLPAPFQAAICTILGPCFQQNSNRFTAII